jgi:Family of unknown function (DUF5343)
MLKKMGFLDATGRPTETYGLLKNKKVAKAAVADGLGKLYAPLFEANEKANELKPEDLKGLIAQSPEPRRTLSTKLPIPSQLSLRMLTLPLRSQTPPRRTKTAAMARSRRSHHFPQAEYAPTSTSIFRCTYLRMAPKKLI